MKKMTGMEFAVHVVVWIASVVGMFYVWSFCDDYRRVMAAPNISAIGNGLAVLAVMVIVMGDIFRNEKRFKAFVVETLEAWEANHQARLRYVARRQAMRRRARESQRQKWSKK